MGLEREKELYILSEMENLGNLPWLRQSLNRIWKYITVVIGITANTHKLKGLRKLWMSRRTIYSIVWWLTLGVLTLKSYGLSSSFQGLKCVEEYNEEEKWPAQGWEENI